MLFITLTCTSSLTTSSCTTPSSKRCKTSKIVQDTCAKKCTLWKHEGHCVENCDVPCKPLRQLVRMLCQGVIHRFEVTHLSTESRGKFAVVPRSLALDGHESQWHVPRSAVMGIWH